MSHPYVKKSPGHDTDIRVKVDDIVESALGFRPPPPHVQAAQYRREQEKERLRRLGKTCGNCGTDVENEDWVFYDQYGFDVLCNRCFQAYD
ncbi:hypothetical protein COV42_01430 [Candidatus Campbellbacteria bacterium CG11_big_fil_rev_8_21_14_0_20_44_21]|uniref:Uncharacterized protein n=1 Tax=Candidatus Campbellbacteria bacterium CG22_combo_CG10-13_8_21_14_all_43_18 TaxID=1974530 RepID=A0A2H0DX71_9BACT|nr:MAG: hypothetical protein COW82_00340 [Candidatus Campbellbacteria bacterium CG22_combo_CG10-13_8_21_14_all_43_18]PIR24321.1 MAG: hypothetical protein COV42_01430 [Candidatus Campbellbacteria bacterium CG11_big_fil_rev_8_21_14_0_20_44_21]